ncbi:MAG: gliding motility-associated C-terminal domain-containing protein [Bacteroidales bacterium]
MQKVFKYFILLFLLNGVFFINTNAQIYAPDNDWADTTKYSTPPEEAAQDSIFIFYEDNEPWLRAQFSDSSTANYAWYKYNENVALNHELPYGGRFEELVGESDSTVIIHERGAYLVEVNRQSDDSTETYIAWVMVDEVEVNSLEVRHNTCQSLELILNTTPQFFEVFSLFAYFDLYTDTHQEKNVLGTDGYFSDHNFESLNSEVEVNSTLFGLPYIIISSSNEANTKSYGPFHDSEYKFTLTTPFGRGDIEVTSDEVTAISTKADFDIYFNQSEEELPDWEMQDDEFPSSEALLEIKLESTAENADSIFWNIINDEMLFIQGGDSIIWRDSSYFSSRFEAYPQKEKMIPGVYEVEHVSKRLTANVLCIDTLSLRIEVDTSFIDPTSIPNVFSPNGDGVNDMFLIKEAETSITSIRRFKITIMNKYGKKVYVYTGNPKEWEGWNGKVDGNKGDATEGVYYFVIEALGWDGRRYRGENYTGFIHLFR